MCFGSMTGLSHFLETKDRVTRVRERKEVESEVTPRE